MPLVFTNFMAYCKSQEYYRILWIGICLVVHGCILTPLTVITIMFSGPTVPVIAYGLAMLSMVMVLVTNLAALPTKITIPVFVLSILADLVIVAAVLL